MSRQTVHLIGSVVIAFILGIGVGTAGARKRAWHRWDPQKRHEQILKTFSKRLNLTADQQTEIGKILETGHQRMRSLHEQVRPQFESLRAETSGQIRALLKPEQAEKFDAMESEFNKRWDKFPGRSKEER